MNTTVIVVTYEWPRALDRVLESLAAQRSRLYEVIVADDGSGQDTRRVVDDWKRRFPAKLIHLWQEDHGFRAARARNLGIKAASGDYLIFLDGDCLAMPDLIEKHEALAEPGWFVTGRRAFLNAKATALTLDGRLTPTQLPTWQHLWRAKSLYEKSSHARRHVRFAPWFDRKREATSVNGVEANFAAWRADLLAIGGFDERFTQYGYEDLDLALRLVRKGIGRKSGDYAALALHLHHPRREIGGGSQALWDEVCRATNTVSMQSVLLEAA